MLMKKWRLLIYPVISIIVVLSLTVVSFAGTLVEDFDDGDTAGWERSPQNEDNDDIFWGVVDGEMMFDPEGQAWDAAISQMNFVGTPQVSNVSEWTDYEVEVDIRHATMANYPGGVRARVDLETGGHYVVWFYPATSKITLYKNPGWDINVGLVNLGEGAYKPTVDEFYTLKLSCEGDTITVFYDDEEIISAEDSDHAAGTIALCVQDQVVYFDNVKVTGDEIPNANMSPVEPAGKLVTTWGTLKRAY